MKELGNVKSAVQVPCKLCGVSFNIGRVRRPNEPFRAGWSPLCGEPAALPEDRNKARQWENFISKDFVKWRRCKISTGCQDVVASIDRDMESQVESVSDDEDDDDYTYESNEDDEPLEYTSEVASEEKSTMGDAESFTRETVDAFTDLLGTTVDEDSKSVDEGGFLFTNEIDLDSKRGTEDQQRKLSVDDSSRSPHLMAEADNVSDSDSSDSTEWQKDWDTCQKLEHLAGPRCNHASGYCGFNISAEEMKGCTTLQCLVRKTPEWTSEPDDQEFEQSGEYYLSGLSGQMPSRDIGGPTMTPPRHGAKDLYPDVNESGVPIPFHPTCFEIFTRASRLHTSSIDLVGLTGWAELESDWLKDFSFPHHEAVKESSEQEWHHRPGYEWLAANPIVVPGLATILRLAVGGENTSSKEDANGRPGSEDPFSKLPREIADAILELVSPVDAAALRLAGLARFLAIENWYQELREEMPWLWEVWDTVLPSFWAITTVSTLSAEMRKKEEAERQRVASRKIIQQELPEIAEIWDIDHAKVNMLFAACGNEGMKETIVLPKDGTNWCRVYYEVKKNWKTLKGLHNRERIWKDVEEIFRRIDKYRGEGSIA